MPTIKNQTSVKSDVKMMAMPLTESAKNEAATAKIPSDNTRGAERFSFRFLKNWPIDWDTRQ